MTNKSPILEGMEDFLDANPSQKKKSKKGDLYQWMIGKEPPILGAHSLAKHRVLQEYIEKYVAILTANRRVEQLTLSLVDGFSGGGTYLHPESGDRIPGSPILMLNAIALAETKANVDRRKKFKVNGNYYFVDEKKTTLEYLKQEVASAPSAIEKHDHIHYLKGSFSSHLDEIIQHIKKKGKAHRAIFLLDQYGYTDVPMADIRKIFAALPRAEVILTLAVDWLTHFVNDTARFTATLKNLELEHRQDLLVRLREQHSQDWRAQIQHVLHQHFYETSGADCYTPFFVHSVDSNRAYWLLHFSKHSTARDAMMELHWEMKNHFEHFGKPGFGMLCLGYDPRNVSVETQGTFGFDQSARALTTDALLVEIPEKLSQHKGLVPYRHFFDANVNDTPATKAMIAEAITQLAKDRELEIFSNKRKERKPGVKLNDEDLIRLPQTKTFFQSCRLVDG